MRTRGPSRAGAGTKIISVRSITEEDFELLRRPAAKFNLSNIRDSHHNVARHLASGMKAYEVAAATGYSTARILMLRDDPAMVELVAYYRELITEGWAATMDAHQAVAIANMRKAERMLSDKLDAADEANDTLPVRELIAITSDRMDRFGYGKKTANLNINVDFAAKLEAAIARTNKKVAAE
jgi:hypothetical protein